jgi:conjugal transfer/entry exclusion protein
MTLLHQLSDEVKNMEEIKDVQEVEYDISNLDERHKKLFDTIMEQTKKVVLKVTGANEKIKSEEDAEAKATS